MPGFERMVIFPLVIRARTRWGDDLVKKHLAEGTTQVVTLGAGFDCRALRFARPGVTFYEVDRAELLAFKAKRLQAGGVQPVAIPVHADYTAADVVDALSAAGLDRARRTLVLWEGNTYYLPNQENERVLRTLAAGLADVLIAFDYFGPEIIDGRSASPGLRQAVAALQRLGAPWQGHFDDLSAVAAKLGLAIVENRRHHEIHADYLPHQDLGDDAGAEVSFALLRRS
jgi:methyltransferase (TIGR00027 family)